MFERDAPNVARGLYPAPDDGDGPLPQRLARLRAFLRDVEPAGRRRAGEGRTLVRQLPAAEGLPDYYLHDFHYQDGGYLTEASARAYDTQVETLFVGAANAMRRQALVPLIEHFSKRDQRGCILLDIGCGTGRFLMQMAKAWPQSICTGVDIDPTGIEIARNRIAEPTGYLGSGPRVIHSLWRSEPACSGARREAQRFVFQTAPCPAFTNRSLRTWS